MHTSSGDHHAYHAKDPATVSAVNPSRATVTRRHPLLNRSAFCRAIAELVGEQRLIRAEDHSRRRPAVALPNQSGARRPTVHICARTLTC
jgi:hypothetical protein